MKPNLQERWDLANGFRYGLYGKPPAKTSRKKSGMPRRFTIKAIPKLPEAATALPGEPPTLSSLMDQLLGVMEKESIGGTLVSGDREVKVARVQRYQQFLARIETVCERIEESV